MGNIEGRFTLYREGPSSSGAGLSEGGKEKDGDNDQGDAYSKGKKKSSEDDKLSPDSGTKKTSKIKNMFFVLQS